MMSSVPAYLVFSQESRPAPDALRLTAHAAKFFGAKVEIVAQSSSSLRIRLSCAAPAFEEDFMIEVRKVTREDLLNARDAELKGRAGGMAMLAEKCSVVWELHSEASQPQQVALLTLCAICASVALGPVLPPDHSTLFGVRGAIERRDASSRL
jgi:hypothetical protein